MQLFLRGRTAPKSRIVAYLTLHCVDVSQSDTLFRIGRRLSASSRWRGSKFRPATLRRRACLAYSSLEKNAEHVSWYADQYIRLLPLDALAVKANVEAAWPACSHTTM